MIRARRKGSMAAALVTGLAMAACNSALGIDDPIEVFPAGTAGPGMVQRDAGSGADGASSMSTTDARSPSSSDTTYGWADWPMPNPASDGLPNAQSYDSTSFSNVVIDLITGLQWQQSVDENSYAWKDAIAFCAGSTSSGGGWRLPSRIELLSLVDFTRTNPVIDTNAFPSTPPAYYWTSSIFAGDPTNAWNVNFEFSDGMTDKSEMTKLHRVRCVR